MKRRLLDRASRLAALGAPTGADRIGPRVVRASTARREHLLYVDPADYRCSRLARELADEWVEYAAAAQLGGSRAIEIQRAIHQFCVFADEHSELQAPQLTLSDGLVLGLLIDWERSLPERFRPGSEAPAVMANAVHLLVARRSEHPDRDVEPGLARFTRGPIVIGPGRSSERDEFSRADKRALVRAAWVSIHALEHRLTSGRDLAEQGRHPAQSDWMHLPDLLWGLWHGHITPAEISASLPSPAAWPDSLARLVGVGEAGFDPRQGRLRLLQHLVSMLFPATIDLHPFRVLLIDATGHAPEEVTSFGDGDVEFTPNGVRLTLLKQRAGLRRHRFFRDETRGPETEEHVSLDRPRRETSEVVRRLIAITEATRARAEHITDSLFVVGEVGHDRQMRFDYWSPQIGKKKFRFWLEQIGLTVEGTPHIGRLRKSVKVEKVIAAQGRVALASDDHQEATFARHYAQGPTLRIISGEVITTAQDHWFEKAVAGPTVLASQPDSPALQRLGLSATEADELITGQLDMGVASCKNPWQSPFSPAGDLCSVAPLRCLECTNAWILPAHVPQLLLFADHLERLRQRLPPAVFTKVWEQTYVNLQAVLGDHGDEEIAQARKHIEAGEAELYLPLTASTEFDQ